MAHTHLAQILLILWEYPPGYGPFLVFLNEFLNEDMIVIVVIAI